MKKEYDFTHAARGPILTPTGKTRITIFIDDDILSSFRERAAHEGKGYQTLINDALRTLLSEKNTVIDEETLRRVIREELHAA